MRSNWPKKESRRAPLACAASALRKICRGGEPTAQKANNQTGLRCLLTRNFNRVLAANTKANVEMLVLLSFLVWLWLFVAHGRFWASAPELPDRKSTRLNSS